MNRQTVIAALIAAVISIPAGFGAGYWSGFKAGEGQFVDVGRINFGEDNNCPTPFIDIEAMERYSYYRKQDKRHFCKFDEMEKAKRNGTYNRIVCGFDTCPL